MKVLEIDLYYYYYPQGICSIEDFVAYANEHYNTFIELTRFETENCVFPYFISEETKQVYINVAAMSRINEEEVTVLCRADYDSRLERIVEEKCIDCVYYYEDDNDGDNLKGHRDRLSLDGECWAYEKKQCEE